jgi:uncharacterized membrane protein
MLVPVAAFSDFVLAVHILSVVIAFGITFAYPLLFTAAIKAQPEIAPWWFRTMTKISRRIINPFLALVLICGIILATDEHQWSSFYVGWGIIAVIVLGGLEGSVQIPRTKKLAELAERDLAATAVPAGGTRASAEWSSEFQSRFRTVQIVGTIESLIVIVTVFLMATHAGGS